MRRNIFSTYTSWIILINIVFFVFILLFKRIIGLESVASLIALQPSAVFAGKGLWTFITSMFAHFELWHIAANMITLFFLGRWVEKIIGKIRFLILYLGSGVFAGLFYAALSFFFGSGLWGERLFGSPAIFALGASGAIFGLIGLLAVLIPKSRVYLIAGPIIVIILEVIIISVYPSSILGGVLELLVMIYFFFAFYAIFSFNPSLRRYILPIELALWVLPIVAIVPLIIVGLIFPLPIGNTAHLGGLLVGLGYGFYLRRKYPRKTKIISRHFSR